jgi:hypothetical protein
MRKVELEVEDEPAETLQAVETSGKSLTAQFKFAT